MDTWQGLSKQLDTWQGLGTQLDTWQELGTQQAGWQPSEQLVWHMVESGAGVESGTRTGWSGGSSPVAFIPSCGVPSCSCLMVFLLLLHVSPRSSWCE